MKPRRHLFRPVSIFSAPLHYGAPLVAGFMVLVTGLDAQAGDILRGGGAQRGKGSARKSSQLDPPTPAATDAARANARDMLARTDRTLAAMRAMQNAARNNANKGPNNLGENPLKPTVTLPNVPNGLGTGGLKVSGNVTTDPSKWKGAKLPTQTVNNGKTKVTVKQTEQQALLEWETFNIGKNTTLTFDQSKGGENAGQWIAFNKVSDPGANPTQILGKLNADGQVYILNPNGILFGGSSQVNTRGLTASALPINDNLVKQGLLNNRDAQFLFSGLSVPGGADGTPAFNPETPADGKFGDVIVQKGATLTSPADGGGNGGRIMLVGANVTNEGTISTESGQTILAAGLQVAVAAHDSDDPSLRGLDVWVGDVGTYAGTVINNGIIDAPTGSISLTGKNLVQAGVLDSTTSVNLNGRIDLKASYGAVANPNFDSDTEEGSGGPMFLNQFTGTVTLGEGSSTRILPDYASKKTVPGLELPQRSQINIEGLAVHFDENSALFAPNAEVSIRAGSWTYQDVNGDRTVFGADGKVEPGITNHYTAGSQRFLADKGQIYIGKGASISVAGSVDVFVPLAQSMLTIELRGSELADSPLQRDSNLRNVPLVVDIRDTGSYNGKYWIGTPLGDVTGLAGLISRNAAQLTAKGGDINLSAGGSIVVREKSSLDVSGGFYNHEEGAIRTSYLIKDGRLVPIKDATPDQVYDGVFNGQSTFNFTKWGVSKTYSTPLFTATNSKTYVEGAAGGTLTINAPSMAIAGDLRGVTIKGPRQRSNPPAAGGLKINFTAEKPVTVPGSTTINYITHSPTPPTVTLTNRPESISIPEFTLVNDAPSALPASLTQNVQLSTDLLEEGGFGTLEVNNPDGDIIVPENVTLNAGNKGSISFSAANLNIQGDVIARGGKLSFTTYNLSPSFVSEYQILNPSGTVALPTAVAGRGMFLLGDKARLDASGLISDDRAESTTPEGEAIIIDGGEISIRSYSADLAKGSIIDVSGGVHVSDKAARSYGKGGAITIAIGSDPGFSSLLGGTLKLGSTLSGYSGATGGSLSIQAGVIEIGTSDLTGALHLGEGFFRKGGFSKYTLSANGARSSATPPAGQFESYIPAITVGEGATIRPVADSLIAEETESGAEIVLKQVRNQEGLRSPVSLSFNATGMDDPFTVDSLEVRADIVMAAGSSIVTDAGGSVSFKGDTVTLLGSVTTPGGKITVSGASSFPLRGGQRNLVTQALPTVHIGSGALLSAAGKVVLKPDAFGRRTGTVYDGGSISLSGNIVAEEGSLLDVSGTSGVLDLDPATLASNAPGLDTGGLNSTPPDIRGVATRVDSDGGIIDLSGAQMLLSDATLRAFRGGETAKGGTLFVSSGRYYLEGEERSGADVNLVVTQSGNVIVNPGADIAVGSGLTDSSGNAYGNMGTFALDRFADGGFDSLSLGGKYFPNASPIRFGGNVSFKGKIDLKVKGALRLAAGGIVTADSAVNISAANLAIGQDFLTPENPDDAPYVPFVHNSTSTNFPTNYAPTFGSGRLNFNANMIDVGTLSLQGIGSANFRADGGDIRGNGTLSAVGDIVLNAERIYPTTASSFSVFAYDPAGSKGSVAIRSNGSNKDIPLSAGGSLSIQASNIVQKGVLLAPLGSITLGWDGTDLDPDDADIDSPYDAITAGKLAVPVTQQLTLGNTSITSVSAAGEKGSSWLTPYGNSPDGQSWIDPRGVDVTLNGLPNKSVSFSAENLDMGDGAVVDIRGGGDLLATRWISGTGGSVNLLGNPTTSWGGGTEYQAGDLVTYNGETWSARVRHSGQTPAIGLYWTKVAESYAIIPTSGIKVAPFSPFNTGSNADALGGDAGYVSSKLGVGDTITLEGGGGIAAGTYTLLPSRYALLPGAFLVTKVSSTGSGVVSKPDGSSIVSGYLGNRFTDPDVVAADRFRFEIASNKVVGTRAQYELLTANKFLSGIADELDVTNPQQIPGDAGHASFHGNSSLRLAGELLTKSPGLGASVDISSFSGIKLSGNNAGATSIRTSVLSSWNVDSLLIGGIRRQNADGSASIEVRTSDLVLDNPVGSLEGADVVLVSKGELKITDGSSITASDAKGYKAQSLTVSGDGALVRVSADSTAQTGRADVGNGIAAMLRIGSAATIDGNSVVLDSTFGTKIASNVNLEADSLILGSGQISVVLDGATGVSLDTTVDPHLVLSGSTLRNVIGTRDLTLRSYRSIDFHGSGIFGSETLETLTLSSGGIRGFGQNGGTLRIEADRLTLENPVNAASAASPALMDGSLVIDAKNILLGSNTFRIGGYRNVSVNAGEGFGFSGTGAFSTSGDLTLRTSRISGESGANYSITSDGVLSLERLEGDAQEEASLGANLTLQGASVLANTDIRLPSGNLTIRATSGDLTIGGNLYVGGASKSFNTQTRFSDAGSITLEAANGDVTLTGTSVLSVAALSGGGNAGTISVVTPNGGFTAGGALHGQAANGFNSGSFRVDTASLPGNGAGSLASINADLDAGGFTQSRGFRVRSGDVLVDHDIRSHAVSITADSGNLTVTGKINAAGNTGGSISLAAHGNLTIASGAELLVTASTFNSAGKGGSIVLEAGTQRDGVANNGALLDLQSGARIDLSVLDYVAGSYSTPGSCAFEGKFTGTLHLRAPRTTTNDGLGISSLQSTITGASAVIAEGFKVYEPANGAMDIALRNQIHADSTAFLGAAGTGNANETAIRTHLLDGAVDAAGLESVLVIAPGVEIINRSGDLTLGLANNASTGTTNVEALAAADWDLSQFRYGTKSAAGVLTLRANGDLVFNNTLSDGFDPIAQGNAQTFADNGHSLMWLATLSKIKDTLPVNAQSWSYRLTAGADTNAAGFRSVLSESELDSTQPGKGSVIIGEFYPAVPNTISTGGSAAIGTNGQTADSIRISTTTTNRGNRFEVVRTGTGDIAVTAGRDVQLRNQFSTIYTAGVAIPVSTTIFSENDFTVPVIPTTVNRHPSQSAGGGTLGAVQQIYQPVWSMAGGNISITAGANIGRYTLSEGVIIADSSRQMPTNWLYRRGYVDPSTGLFANNGGFGTNSNPNFQNADNVTDQATSTTWWIDFSNFFQGVGTLGGGNIDMSAGNDIVNVDAVAPTNARMAGRKKNPDFGVVADAPEYLNLAPDEANLLEYGGGDVTIRSGRNIDGGIYYVEKGQGVLKAGGAITTNAARSPSLGILTGEAAYDPLTWLPTTLFVGKSNFDVSANGDILLGPVSNPFLLPQGINNKFWYKTAFSTYSEDSGVTVASYGGSVTHRTEVNLPDGVTTRPALGVWFGTQNLFNGGGSESNASFYQPWLRLNEMSTENHSTLFTLFAPNLSSTAFGGDINLAGDITLAPSSEGNVELFATGGIIGLQPMGPGFSAKSIAQVWSASTVNLSDASLSSLPSVTNPLAYQSVTGRDRIAAVQSNINLFQSVDLALSETGSYRGTAGTTLVKQALHGSSLLHAADPDPVRFYATGGDITGLTLFSPKKAELIAQRDIADIALYLQNLDVQDVTLVSAGRDIIPFSENSSIRSTSNDLDAGNFVGDTPLATVAGGSTNAMAGDIQINGPGVLEVLAGRTIDLGTGANFIDGTGVGISSIGNNRNPNLPFTGADLIVLAGVSSPDGNGPALGLSFSSLDIETFTKSYLKKPEQFDSVYRGKLGRKYQQLSAEQQAVVALEKFYKVLRKAGRDAAETGSYQPGYTAIKTLFGKAKPLGEILTRAREIRTTSGGSISLGVPGGDIRMASEIFGNPLTPPGVVTEYGGSVSTFTDGNVDIGQARIFTLRGGDITMWSSNGNIAAGSSPRTVVTAPPTRVLIDISSADIQTDLGGLATGGGIGVLAAVEGVKPGNVDLIAPKGYVDAGDAGIRVTGNLNIAAQVVLNTSNISAGGTTTGAAPAAPAAPSVSAVTSASNANAATTATTQNKPVDQTPQETAKPQEDIASLYTVEVIGYGGGSGDDEEDEEKTEDQGGQQ